MSGNKASKKGTFFLVTLVGAAFCLIMTFTQSNRMLSIVVETQVQNQAKAHKLTTEDLEFLAFGAKKNHSVPAPPVHREEEEEEAHKKELEDLKEKHRVDLQRQMQKHKKELQQQKQKVKKEMIQAPAEAPAEQVPSVTETPHSRGEHVVLFITDSKYADAVAHSVMDIRKAGGYKGDIAVVLDEGKNYTLETLQAKIKQSGGKSGLNSVSLFTTQQLDAMVFQNLTQDLQCLHHAPPPNSCHSGQRAKAHRPYFLKTLMFHPIFAERWNKVLFMDACMTFHSPHINEILKIPDVHNSLLAALDPWQYAKGGLQWKLLAKEKCRNETGLKFLSDSVKTRLVDASYYNSAFVFYDTSLVRDYQLPAEQFGTTLPPGHSTLIEMLHVYHKLSLVFRGGSQQIHSVYWIYMRPNAFRVLPYSMLNSPRIPYEFHPRIAQGKYVVTAGNLVRPVCTKRPTNSVNFAATAGNATTK